MMATRKATPVPAAKVLYLVKEHDSKNYARYVADQTAYGDGSTPPVGKYYIPREGGEFLPEKATLTFTAR